MSEERSGDEGCEVDRHVDGMSVLTWIELIVKRDRERIQMGMEEWEWIRTVRDDGDGDIDGNGGVGLDNDGRR